MQSDPSHHPKLIAVNGKGMNLSESIWYDQGSCLLEPFGRRVNHAVIFEAVIETAKDKDFFAQVD